MYKAMFQSPCYNITFIRWSKVAYAELVYARLYFSLLAGIKDFSLTVKVATLIFISGRALAISSTKEGKSGFIYNLVKS